MLVWFKSLTWDKLIGALLVLALHAMVLYAAMSYKLIPPPEEVITLMVSLINLPPPKKEEPLPLEPPKPLPKKVVLDRPKPKPIEPPKPTPMLVAEAPVTYASEYVAPPHSPEPIVEVPVAPEPVVVAASKPPASVTLSSELSLACPQRTPPNYPAASRRVGEQGRVVLSVALDETGRITSVKVKESSGHHRLDEAGLAAIKSWKCNPAMRDGVAVRAEALQPFDFILN